MKKIIKITLGIIIFLSLPTMLLFGFLYLKYNEPLPDGIEGKAADILAEKMLDALDYEAYDETDYIEFTFKNSHRYQWNKAEKTCKVFWKSFRVELDLLNPENSKVFVAQQEYNGKEKQDYIQKAESYFNNDSFWLVAPYKVFDDGTKRRLVKTDDGREALLVTYTSGGTTPGDSYLWHLDSKGMPSSFQMWVDILPIDGLEASWKDWTTTKTGVKLPTFHELLVLGIEISNIKTE